MPFSNRWPQWREGVPRGAYLGVLFAPLPEAAPGLTAAAPRAAPAAEAGMAPAPAPDAREPTSSFNDGSMLTTADNSLAHGRRGSAGHDEAGPPADGSTGGLSATRQLLGSSAAEASGQDIGIVVTSDHIVSASGGKATGSSTATSDSDGDAATSSSAADSNSNGDTATGSSAADGDSDGNGVGKATVVVKPCPWCRHPAERVARTAFLAPAADFQSGDTNALLYVKETWLKLQTNR